MKGERVTTVEWLKKDIMEKDKNINWEMMAKDMAGELSLEEKAHFEKELVHEEGFSDTLTQVKHLWDDMAYAREVNDIDTDKAWGKVDRQSHLSSSRRIDVFSWKKVAMVAAVLVVVLGSALTFIWSGINASNKMLVANAGVLSIDLEDGSKVMLNRESSILYPEKFAKNERVLELKGEGFFKVARDASRPFVIKAGALSIQVLGTSFNVQAFAEDEVSVVTVSTGKVRVSIEGTDVYQIIEAGEAVTFAHGSVVLLRHANENKNVDAWLTKELVFTNMTLAEVFTTLEHVYDISINVQDSVLLEGKVLNASFSQRSLNHVMQSVCTSFNLGFEEENDGFWVKKR